MNSSAARWRAIAVTFIAFGLATALLVGLWIGLDRVPAAAGLLPFSPTSPASWADRASPTGTLVVAVGVFLAIGAGVLALNSTYLDRMYEIFADVLLMVFAALAGTATGAWGVLFALGSDPAIDASAFIPMLALFVIVHVVLFLVPTRARAMLLMRLFLILAMPVAGLALLSEPFFA